MVLRHPVTISVTVFYYAKALSISNKSTHGSSLVSTLFIWEPRLRLLRERIENAVYIAEYVSTIFRLSIMSDLTLSNSFLATSFGLQLKQTIIASSNKMQCNVFKKLFSSVIFLIVLNVKCVNSMQDI